MQLNKINNMEWNIFKGVMIVLILMNISFYVAEVFIRNEKTQVKQRITDSINIVQKERNRVEESKPFTPYYSNIGTLIKTREDAKNDTIPYKQPDREYIKYLVTTAYYYGINRDVSVRNNESLKNHKLQQDLEKLTTAVDQSFK